MGHTKGGDWVRAKFEGRKLSKLGETVANILADTFGGLHHLDANKLGRVKWENKSYMAVQLDHNTLSTFDPDSLTRLIILCHDNAIRLEISARTINCLELLFSQRQRVGKYTEYHPSITSHLAMIRRSLEGNE